VRIDRINCSFNQLLLELTELPDIFVGLLSLDSWVSADHTEARAGRVEETSIEFREFFWNFPSVVVRDDAVGHSQPVKVAIQRLQSFLLEVVSNENTGVLHELSDVSALSTRGSCHVKNSFLRLRGQSHNWKE